MQLSATETFGVSGGQQQMLAMVRALMSKPRRIVLDDASMGLAPLVVDRIYKTLFKPRERGVSVLLAELNPVSPSAWRTSPEDERRAGY